MSFQHQMNINKIYFYYILKKMKIYETRIYDERRQKIKLLDVIQFREKESKQTFNAKIIQLSYFKNFKDAIIDSGIKNILPNANSIEEGVKIYQSFPHKEGTYKEAANKYGVLRMKFELV